MEGHSSSPMMPVSCATMAARRPVAQVDRRITGLAALPRGGLVVALDGRRLRVMAGRRRETDGVAGKPERRRAITPLPMDGCW